MYVHTFVFLEIFLLIVTVLLYDNPNFEHFHLEKSIKFKLLNLVNNNVAIFIIIIHHRWVYMEILIQNIFASKCTQKNLSGKTFLHKHNFL